MSSIWTLGGEDCRCLSLTVGLAQTDTAEVEFPGGGGAGITDGEWLTLACDSVPLFYGQATVRREVSGRSDSLRVSLRGPWDQLERTGYQQYTKVTVPHDVDETHPYGYALASILTPQVLLGMDDDGGARTTLQEAQAIVAYADTAGVPVTLSASFTGLPMQPVPAEGVSCAAALLTVLRFHPDVLLYFDYSSGPGAVLMAVPASSGTVVTISGGAAGSARVEDAAFERVSNYAPKGVRILYLRTSADGRLEAHEDTDTEGKTNFWQSHLDWLEWPGVAEIITITAHTVTVDKPNITPSQDGDDGIEEDWSLDPEDYPRELVDGTIPAWLPKVAAPLTVRAKFAVGDTSGLSSDTREALALIFNNSPGITRKLQITGTDANTREYTALASVAGPPDWPAGGVAAAYMAAFAVQAWQGGLTLTGAAIPQMALGKLINLSGYASAWGSMNAVLKSVSYSPQSHSLSLSCGPPENFGFGDFVELQRTMKKAAGTDARAAAERRNLALAHSRGNIRGVGFTAHRSVSSDDGVQVGDVVPWQCISAGGLNLRFWPAQIFNGDGTYVWPMVGVVTAAPEDIFDAELTPGGGSGWLYVECTVDDTDDYHGLTTAAEVKVAYGGVDFLTLAGGKVLVPICQFNAGSSSITLAPLRTYVFCLRRFGPPGVGTWDTTPL